MAQTTKGLEHRKKDIGFSGESRIRPGDKGSNKKGRQSAERQKRENPVEHLKMAANPHM